VKRNKELLAVDINVIERCVNGTSTPKANSGPVYQGFIAALKDNYGFIETDTHDKEVFFHYSNFEGDVATLELGCEVEYTVGVRPGNGSCVSAENVTVLPKGTIEKGVTIKEEIMTGKVERPLKSVNPEQEAYCGIVRATPSEETEEPGPTYDFGITGLVNKRELLQAGDPVQFQVDSNNRAVNISAVRKKKKATVDSIKGPFGFLSYEPEEGKKLFFHMSEVKDGVVLQSGDSVEFVVVTNHRNKKSYACNVVKIGDGQQQQRPERLIGRLRSSLDESGPRLILLRQPNGPGDSPFGPRVPRTPGQLIN